MDSEAQNAAKLIRELSDLAKRLSERNIIVVSVVTDYWCFRGWEIIVAKNNVVMKFIWDGRDCNLVSYTSPKLSHSYPKEWKLDIGEGFERDSGDAPMRFIEGYLAKRMP